MPQPTPANRTTSTQKHLVQLEGVTHIDDGDGGTIEKWDPLEPPTRWAMIEAARRRDVEAVTGSVAIQAVATHLITLDYHRQLNVQSRIWYHGREFQIHAISNVNEENWQQVCVCTEVLTDGSGTHGAGRAARGAAADAV